MTARDARDRELGMGREISRRDFLQGALGGAVGSAVGGLVAGAWPRAAVAQPEAGAASSVGTAGVPASPSLHPPSRTGLRGSHVGSFEVAHQMAFERRTDWGPAHEPDPGEYDLVVVGTGVSGLSAAFLYLEQHPGARVL
ncbi:MAG: twin-arginine translocation signal domain-containing protein, partial [Myxococcota bacterium]|nr:twin-arginine translocation signal domain-containing protein [Myxococcota bacterium]